MFEKIKFQFSYLQRWPLLASHNSTKNEGLQHKGYAAACHVLASFPLAMIAATASVNHLLANPSHILEMCSPELVNEPFTHQLNK